MNALRLTLTALLCISMALLGAAIGRSVRADLADHADAMARADAVFCDHDWHGRAPSECPNDKPE